MKDGKNKQLPSFWIPSLTPDAAPKIEEKPVSVYFNPVSNELDFQCSAPVIKNSYFPYNIFQQNLLRLKLSIFVLLSPSYFFRFVLPKIIIYKSKTTIFSLQSNIIITSLFWKLTKVSTNNLKARIKGTSGRLKMCKNIIPV